MLPRPQSILLLLVGLTTVASNLVKFKKQDDPATNHIIDVGVQVGMACGQGKHPVVLGKNEDSDFMKCTVTEAKKLNQGLPKGLFKEFFTAYDERYARGGGKHQPKSDMTKELWRKLIEDALEALRPDEYVQLRATSGKGQQVHEQIAALMADKANTFETIFGTKYNPVLTGLLGKTFSSFGTGADGAVYEVKQDGVVQNAIFKAVPARKKLNQPVEFQIQNEIFNLRDEKFVPRPIEQGRSTNEKWDFMVMEKLGPVVGELAKDSKKLAKTDVERVLGRALVILKEIHKAGYAHNDAHSDNWAVSLTDSKVLELFDFGRSVNMKETGDWMPAVADLRSWVSLARELVDKHKTDKTFYEKYDDVIKKLAERFNQDTWQHADVPTITIPFADFKLNTQTALEKYSEAFYTLAEVTFNAKQHGFASPDTITQWSAKNAKPPGGRRKRRVTQQSEGA